MQQNGKIITALIIAAAVVGGGVYFGQQKIQVAVNAPNAVIPEQNQDTPEEPIEKTKTSLDLMNELVAQQHPTALVENYKIFEEVESPDSSKTAVLFGLDMEKTQECCARPTGIFINAQGKLGAEYDIPQGALQHMYLDNVAWQDNNNVQYDFVISDESGIRTAQESIAAE